MEVHIIANHRYSLHGLVPTTLAQMCFIYGIDVWPKPMDVCTMYILLVKSANLKIFSKLVNYFELSIVTTNIHWVSNPCQWGVSVECARKLLTVHVIKNTHLTIKNTDS